MTASTTGRPPEEGGRLGRATVPDVMPDAMPDVAPAAVPDEQRVRSRDVAPQTRVSPWFAIRGGADRRPQPSRPPTGSPTRPGRDRGSVTAELAAALPALVLLLVVGITAVSAAGTKLRCVAAARDAALSQARGGDGASDARRVAPDGARVKVATDGDVTRAEVSADIRLFSRRLPGLVVSATAVAAVEPGAP